MSQFWVIHNSIGNPVQSNSKPSWSSCQFDSHFRWKLTTLVTNFSNSTKPIDWMKIEARKVHSTQFHVALFFCFYDFQYREGPTQNRFPIFPHFYASLLFSTCCCCCCCCCYRSLIAVHNEIEGSHDGLRFAAVCWLAIKIRRETAVFRSLSFSKLCVISNQPRPDPHRLLPPSSRYLFLLRWNRIKKYLAKPISSSGNFTHL